MNIAHFTNTYKPNVNGVVRSVSTFREGLSELGHLVFIFAQEAPKDYVDPEQFIFRYPGVNIPRFNYSLTLPSSSFVDELLPSLKLDVIHSNHPLLVGGAAANQAEKFGLPLVFTFHTRYVEYAEGYTDYIPFSKSIVEGIVVDGLVKYINRCQHVVTPSDSIKQTLEELAGTSDRVTTIPTGIDLDPFRKADGRAVRQKYNLGDETVLVSVGRLAEEKNFKTLLSAVAEAAKKHDDLRLLLIGDGPQRNDLEKYAQELGLGNRVIFTGLVPFEDIPDHLKAADIFSFASITETQGLVTMEAMAADLPVVAVDASGTSDVVTDGEEGLLTENDSHALAQALMRVLNDEALMARLEDGVKEKAKSFDMMVQAEKMVGVYEQAIEDKKANRHIEVDGDYVKRKMKQRD
ncbi:MAG: glycosyltransferase [Candidatus Promineifilaceae bacterium]